MKSTVGHILVDGYPVFVPNKVEDSGIGYYVSYNNHDDSIYGCDTTAIVIDKTGAFLILNGDHGKTITGMSLKDVCQYFHDHADLHNHMSDPHEDFVLPPL